MKNLELKKELIENGTFQEYLIKRSNYYKENNQIIYYALDYQAEYFNVDLNTMKALEQMRKCKNQQYKRIKEHILFMIINNYDLYFSTYTINEKSLNENNLDIDKIKDQLTKNFRSHGLIDWIGNIDYGSKNGRPHFHVIEAYQNGIIKKEINNKNNKSIINLPTTTEWEKIGFTNHQQIRTDLNQQDRTALYLAKLTNHTLKVRKHRIFTNKKSDYQNYKKFRDKKGAKGLEVLDEYLEK